ncbi:LacI family DNA-binding transcriptional regulator [Acidimangrovimonas sediminis]|uniref:LacI family DNA-binding transcriptional regulator n=1 Tax=Acidimangrovimonas sediminis TaxID=2056283 RepID=UPI000C801390|nr:LacI family DNA-binding transcriptional regulator [Acidimangrovimonas sediminis]
MARRPTIKDLAREAGVSAATVDRVLNGRSRVRDETIRKVAGAAHRIGFHAQALIDRRLGQSLDEVTLGFVLHKERQEFYQNFAREIDRAVQARTDVRGRAIIRFAPSQSPGDFAGQLRDMGRRAQAVAGSAVNHPELTRAVQELKDGGIATFAVLNDFALGVRQNYLGLNNIKVGRIAAWQLATQIHAPGKLAVFVGGSRWHGHELRETGFRSYFREYAPAFEVLDTLVNLETRQLTYEATLALLARHPDLRGIYVAGGGMEGAIAALREARPPGKVALVVNELTAASQAALSERYVSMAISTPLPELCRTLVDLMIASVLTPTPGIVGQSFVEPQIHVPESV